MKKYIVKGENSLLMGDKFADSKSNRLSDVTINTLDIVRVVAMTGIIGDHYLQWTGIPVLANTGLQWGVFLMIFFTLSSYLFGMKWAKNNHKAFETVSFLKRRCLRIYIPLWIILPALVGFEWLVINSGLNMKAIVFNIFGLGWAKPLGVAGHLWFITLMMFLYVAFVLFSHLRMDKIRLRWWGCGLIILSTIIVLAERWLVTFSSVAPIIVLFFGSVFFYKGEGLVQLCRCYYTKGMFIATVLFISSWWMYLQGWHSTHKAIATLASFSAGFAIFVCLISLLDVKIKNKVVNHFADISYEVYLVHVPLHFFVVYLLGMRGLDNHLIIVLVWLMLTYACALAVHTVSAFIIKRL